jgi:hypothetical protein
VVCALLGGCGAADNGESSWIMVGHKGNKANRAPVVKAVRLHPNPVMVTSPVLVEVDAGDDDGDLIDVRHTWFVNGNAIEGQRGSTLPPRLVKRGDTLAVEVIPVDGKTEGVPVRVETTVGNSPPLMIRVALESGAVLVGERVRAQVEGEDPDQDALHYTYRWWRNGSLLAGQQGDSLETAGFVHDDSLTVEVTPFDETSSGKPVFSSSVRVGNSPPKIASVPPGLVSPTRYEYQVQASDPDGDVLTYRLAKAPVGMAMDAVTGFLHWALSPQLKGSYAVRVLVEDGHEGHAFQDFDIIVASAPPPTS